MILIGSRALNYRLEYEYRKPIDWDFVCTWDEAQEYIKEIKRSERIIANYPINSGKSLVVKTQENIYEFEIAWSDSRAERLVEFVERQSDNIEIGGITVPSLDVLYLLKMSHRYLKDSPAFKKTMLDILEFRKLGAKIRPEHEEFYEQRQKDTYTNNLPKLNQSKEGFFDNSNNIYTIDHDDIHEAVKHLERPAYEYFKDGSVWCSKALWDACDEHTRLLAGLEETYVLSLERSIHPFPNVDRKWAFDKALEKLATSISSGWFREFVWEKYYNIQAMYDVKYIDKFYDALHNGRIKAFTSSNY